MPLLSDSFYNFNRENTTLNIVFQGESCLLSFLLPCYDENIAQSKIILDSLPGFWALPFIFPPFPILPHFHAPSSFLPIPPSSLFSLKWNSPRIAWGGLKYLDPSLPPASVSWIASWSLSQLSRKNKQTKSSPLPKPYSVILMEKFLFLLFLNIYSLVYAYMYICSYCSMCVKIRR